MPDLIKIETPANPKYLPAMRLLIGGLCAAKNTDLETIEDIKMAVGECANVFYKERDKVHMEFEMGEEIRIYFLGVSKDELDAEDSEMEKLIVMSLVDEIKQEENKVVLIKEIK